MRYSGGGKPAATAAGFEGAGYVAGFQDHTAHVEYVTRARASYEAARVLLEESVAAHPRDPRMHIALGLTYAGLHRGANARREALLPTEISPISDNSPAAAAFMEGAVEIYAQLGDVDRALELIELLLAMPAGREISVPLLRLDPTFDPLRGDPRFEALIGRFSRS